MKQKIELFNDMLEDMTIFYQFYEITEEPFIKNLGNLLAMIGLEKEILGDEECIVEKYFVRLQHFKKQCGKFIVYYNKKERV